MSMLQVGVIGVLGVLFAVQFKSGKSEYAVYISVAVSLLLFGCMLERLRDAVDSLGRIGNYIKVDQRFFRNYDENDRDHLSCRIFFRHLQRCRISEHRIPD